MTDKSKPAKRTPKPKPTSQDTLPVTNQTVDELACVVEQLIQQIVVLRQAIDEIGLDLQWAIRKCVVEPLPLPSTTSLPSDPLVEDFAERVNTVPPEVVQQFRAEAAREAMGSDQRKQSSLW